MTTTADPGRVPSARRKRLWSYGMQIVRGAAVVMTTFLGLLAVTFFIGRVIPVDPVAILVGDHAPTETIEHVREEMGLNKPLAGQFVIYVAKALQGDFGRSILTTNPVLDDIKRAFPATIELATLATLFGALIGIPLGVYAAVHNGRWEDRLVRTFAMVGHSVPVFWLGLLGLLVFYARLGWVAGPGRIDVAFEYTFTPITGFYLLDATIRQDWAALRSCFAHIVLPALLLGYYSMAYICRMTRSFMLAELQQEYITAARAKGLSEGRVVWGHALRCALVPLVLLEGAVLTETVFSWPGLGLYITNSLQTADMNAVLGGTLVVGAVFVGLNLLSDLLYRTLDPRTRE
jgi:peptide/nickel transport system permease protein